MRFAQPSGMTTSRSADDLVTKTFLCGNVNEEYASNKIFIEGLDASIRHNMREFYGSKRNANLHILPFLATSLLKFQKHNIMSKRASSSATYQKTQQNGPWCFHKPGVNDVQSGSTSSLSASTRKGSDTPVMAPDRTKKSTPADVILSSIASHDALSSMDKTEYCRFFLSKNHKTLQFGFISKDKWWVFTRFCDLNRKQLSTWVDRTESQSCQRKSQNRNRLFQGSTSHKAKIFKPAQQNYFRPQQSALESQKN